MSVRWIITADCCCQSNKRDNSYTKLAHYTLRPATSSGLNSQRFESTFGGSIDGHTKYNVQPNASRFDLWQSGEDLQPKSVKITHDLSDWDIENVDVEKFYKSFRGIPAKMETEKSCGSVFSMEPQFARSFPEELLPLYALLKDSTDVRSRHAREVAKQLGIFESPNKIDVGIGNYGLKESAVTFIELRYRYLCNLMMSSAGGTLADEVRSNLKAEIQLLQILFQVGTANKGRATEEVEDWAQRHSDLMAANRVMPTYASFIPEMTSLTRQATNELIVETMNNWKEWTLSASAPTENELSITSVKETNRHYEHVGPSPIEELKQAPVLTLSAKIAIPKPKGSKELALDLGACTDVDSPPQWLAATEADPLMAIEEYLTIIKCRKMKRNMANTDSPFLDGARSKKEGVAKRIFTKYDKEYSDYVTDLAEETVCEFDWGHLIESIPDIEGIKTRLGKRLEHAQGCLDKQTLRLSNTLNSNYTDPGRRYHRTVRVMRGARPVLDLGDINTAFVVLQSQGESKAAEYLHAKNKNLRSSADINHVLGVGMDVLRVKREAQRLKRGIGAIRELLYGPHGNEGLTKKDKDFDFQKHAKLTRKVRHCKCYSLSLSLSLCGSLSL